MNLTQALRRAMACWPHTTATVLFGLHPLAAQSQQMDMDAMMKWGAADLVRYHIVGVYKAQPHIASDGSGLGRLAQILRVALC
jgi:hypothetical protein